MSPHRTLQEVTDGVVMPMEAGPEPGEWHCKIRRTSEGTRIGTFDVRRFLHEGEWVVAVTEDQSDRGSVVTWFWWEDEVAAVEGYDRACEWARAARYRARE